MKISREMWKDKVLPEKELEFELRVVILTTKI
jgi:hypothetical protein